MLVWGLMRFPGGYDGLAPGFCEGPEQGTMVGVGIFQECIDLPAIGQRRSFNYSPSAMHSVDWALRVAISSAQCL